MSDAGRDLAIMAFILVALGVLWVTSGGPERGSYQSPFLVPPTTIQDANFDALDTVSGTKKQPTGLSGQGDTVGGVDIIEPSEIKKDIKLKVSKWIAAETNPDEEYIELQAPTGNTEPVLITGLRLEGKRGLDVAIGKGVILFVSSGSGVKLPISLEPGEKAYITTGKSPIGSSFKVNKCMGYLSEFNDFTPYLRKSCPLPKDEDLPSGFNDDCLDYIERLPRCKIVDMNPFTNSKLGILTPACKNYLSKEINYNTCILNHKDDSDFYKKEWRIFLGRTEDMWKAKRETISLLDRTGEVVDSVSY